MLIGLLETEQYSGINARVRFFEKELVGEIPWVWG